MIAQREMVKAYNNIIIPSEFSTFKHWEKEMKQRRLRRCSHSWEEIFLDIAEAKAIDYLKMGWVINYVNYFE